MNKYFLFSLLLSVVSHIGLIFFSNSSTKLQEKKEIQIATGVQVELIMNSKKENKKNQTNSKKVKTKRSNLVKSEANNLELIRSRIDKVKYLNPLAQRLKLKGQVEVEFVIHPKNKLSGFLVLKSSGKKLLDESARETIMRFKDLELPKMPEFSHSSKNSVIKLKIIYN